MLDIELVSPAFHTALRKAADNKQSVASWNMLHFMDAEVRTDFYRHICTSLDETFTAHDLRKVALAWAGEGFDGDKSHQCRTFSAILHLHTVEDWTAITQFMRECDVAPSVDWTVDEHSHLADSHGFQVEVTITDSRDLPLASFSNSFRAKDGKRISNWYGRSIIGKPIRNEGGLDAIPVMVETVRLQVGTLLWEIAESKVRPGSIEERSNLDLIAPLDPADPFEAKVIAATSTDAVLLLRYPHRSDGVERVSYVLALPAPDTPFGYTFHRAENVDGEASITKSTIQRWVDAGKFQGENTLLMGMDDDLIGTKIKVSVDSESMWFRSVMEKKGTGAAVLSDGTLFLPRPAPAVSVDIPMPA